MDLLSLRDLPLALAFGIVCLWLYNQANLTHTKQLISLTDSFGKEFKELIAKYEIIMDGLREERRQWIVDQRTEREILLTRLNQNTEAMTNHANQSHQLRNTLNPIFLLAERLNREEKRKGGNGTP